MTHTLKPRPLDPYLDRLWGYLKATATDAFNWASGRKPKVNPALKRRLEEFQQKYAKP
jgi:hypothetical protein